MTGSVSAKSCGRRACPPHCLVRQPPKACDLSSVIDAIGAAETKVGRRHSIPDHCATIVAIAHDLPGRIDTKGLAETKVGDAVGDRVRADAGGDRGERAEDYGAGDE